jgi:hypothetical protein
VIDEAAIKLRYAAVDPEPPKPPKEPTVAVFDIAT